MNGGKKEGREGADEVGAGWSPQFDQERRKRGAKEGTGNNCSEKRKGKHGEGRGLKKIRIEKKERRGEARGKNPSQRRGP